MFYETIPEELFCVLYKTAQALPLGHLSTSRDAPREAKHEVWEFVVQEHDAKRAKKHYDLRLGDPKTQKGYSWAGRYLPKPGEIRLFNLQPVHEIEYFNFEGEIPEGYGAGKVKIVNRSKAYVVESSPDRVKFVVPTDKGNEEYLLLKHTGHRWYVLNTTQNVKSMLPKEILEREKFVDVPKEKIKNYLSDPNYIMQRKDDGIHMLWMLPRNKQIRAVRVIRTSGEPVDHTYNIPDLAGQTARAREGDTILRGEAFLVDKKTKQALPLQYTSSVLLSKPPDAIEKLKALGAEVKRTAFDIDYYKGKPVYHLPYKERFELLKKVAPQYGFDIPHTAIDPKDKEKLFKTIAQGKLKETKEGVVFRPMDRSGEPLRYKFRPELDVYVVDIAPGKGSLQGYAAGGLVFSYTKDGPPAGIVGTGFTLDERIDMWRNKKKYIGRVAKITAQEILPSGKLRQPAFVAWHPEK